MLTKINYMKNYIKKMQAKWMIPMEMEIKMILVI